MKSKVDETIAEYTVKTAKIIIIIFKRVLLDIFFLDSFLKVK